MFELGVADLVGRFVQEVNSRTRRPLFESEVPEELRLGASVDGFTDWRIAHDSEKHWVAEMERLLPARLPPSFRRLLTNYSYPEFELTGVWMYPNTGKLEQDFERAALRDRHLVGPLLAAGYIPFARADSASYDPLCFDVKSPSSDGEWRIVRADHEAALIHGRALVKPFAESFAALVRAFLATPLLARDD